MLHCLHWDADEREPMRGSRSFTVGNTILTSTWVPTMSHIFFQKRHSNLSAEPADILDPTRHFAAMSTEARVVSHSICRAQPLPDL
jgi:hypothetical protein